MFASLFSLPLKTFLYYLCHPCFFTFDLLLLLPAIRAMDPMSCGWGLGLECEPW